MTSFNLTPVIFKFIALALLLIFVIAYHPLGMSAEEAKYEHLDALMSNEDAINKEEEYWKANLTPLQYKVGRESGTERAFTGKYYKHSADGNYHCSNCGQVLFHSSTKFDSGSGWPSFSDVQKAENLTLLNDESHGINRTEVKCARCDAHLGHVFDDGPGPTGKRYCINSVSLVHDEDL